LTRTNLIAVVLTSIVLLAVIAYEVSSRVSEEEEVHFNLISFDCERAFADEIALTDLGPRLAGTEAELKGAEYISSQMSAAGLTDVHIEFFKVPCFEVNNADVSLVTYSPLGLRPVLRESIRTYEYNIDFAVQGNSGSYSWSNFNDDLEITSVGNGSIDEQWSGANGRAAVVEIAGDSPGNTELFLKAEEVGAAALVLHNNLWGDKIGYPPIYKSTYFQEGASIPNIPFFMVSKEAGTEILSGSNNGNKLRIDFDVTVEPRDVPVVIGDVKGSSDSQDFVILGAHHDTAITGPGAVDNTVGVVTVVEMARQLAQYDPKHTIRFATWGAEELGLYGSMKYTEAHAEEISEHCIMCFNLDMPNVFLERDNRLPMQANCNTSVSYLQQIRGLLLEDSPQLSKYDIQIRYDPMKNPPSDHRGFALLGRDICNTWGSGCWEYHTYKETADYVNPESLQLAGRIFGTYALQLANV